MGAGSAVQIQTAPSIAISTEVDRARPCVRITLVGSVDGDEVAAAFLRLYTEDSAAVIYDRLFDLTRYEGGFEMRHLQRLAKVYQALAPRSPPPSRTAFVTPDPHFRLWAASMDHQFRGREFRTFQSFADAELFLANGSPESA